MSDKPSPTAAPTRWSGANPGDYGEDFHAHLLDQYKLFVEMMDRNTDRRSTTNRYFLSVNTVLLAALAGLSKTGLVNLQLGWIFFVAVAGIVLCYCWYSLVRSYKGLNTGKFSIIHELEQQLPYPLYAEEWNRLGRGVDKSKYQPFTSTEQVVPWVFACLYGLLLIWSILETIQ